MMKRNVKCFGLAVLTAAALSVFSASAASAFVSGHFVSEKHHTEFKAVESGAEKTELKLSNVSWATFNCAETSYFATMEGTTVQELTVWPTYAKCVRTVEGGENEKVEVKTNGCLFRVKMGPALEEFHGTAELTCPEGKKIEVTSPSRISVR